MAAEAVDRVLASALVDAAARSALDNAVIERVLEDGVVDRAVERLLESDELWQLVNAVAYSPAVTDAIAQQSIGFADQVAGGVRARSRSADAWIETRVRRALGGRRERHGRAGLRGPGDPRDRLLHRRRPSSTAWRSWWRPASRSPCRCSRCPAREEDVLLALGGTAFLLWAVGYFVTFWSSTGQTPGSRVMRVRVCRADDGLPLRPARALLRFEGLLLAALPLFAGFLPILVDARRRGLQDMLAGTVVVSAPQEKRVLYSSSDWPGASTRTSTSGASSAT